MPELQEVLPKYLQVANYYRDLIVSGDLKPGDEVPSERQLADDWRISRPTATRALAALRNQGLVESRQGSGTFVRSQAQFHRRARDRYMRAQSAGRIYAVGEYADIVAAETAAMPGWVAEAFGGAESELGIRRHRVTYSDGEPAEVSTSWASGSLVDRAPRLLSTARIRAGTVAYLEEVTGRKASYARDQLAARLATAAERRELNLSSRSAAVLVVRHIVFDNSDQPLECVEAAYPPGRWTFEQQYPVSD